MKITKDYGNSCLNYCVLHLFQHKTVAFQNFTILFLPFPSIFSLIITTFVLSELPQNSTKNMRGTREYAQQLIIKDVKMVHRFLHLMV